MARTIPLDGFSRRSPLNHATFADRPTAGPPAGGPATSFVSRRTARRPRPASGPGGEASDEQLFERFRDVGDEGAFETLVHRYEGELFGFLNRYLGDSQSAEDAFQATFLRVYQARAAFQTGRPFRPWLYTIATHQAIDLQRRTRRHRLSLQGRWADPECGAGLADLAVDPGPGADEQLADEEIRDLVQTALCRLPEPQQRVVRLVYEHGLKQHDVARVLGVPVGTVKSRMHAAIRKLAAAWPAGSRLAAAATN